MDKPKKIYTLAEQEDRASAMRADIWLIFLFIICSIFAVIMLSNIDNTAKKIREGKMKAIGSK